MALEVAAVPREGNGHLDERRRVYGWLSSGTSTTEHFLKVVLCVGRCLVQLLSLGDTFASISRLADQTKPEESPASTSGPATPSPPAAEVRPL